MSWTYLVHLANYSDGVLYLMAVLLLVALSVIIDRFWYLHRTLRRGHMVVDQLAALSQPGRPELSALAQRAGDLPEGVLLQVAVRHYGVSDPVQLANRIDEATLLLAPTLDRRLWILDTIVTLAPLLGLFGTILGMFHAFAVLGTGTNAQGAVTGGVADALVATACGLLLAMIGLLAFNALNNEIRQVLHHLDLVKTMLMNRLDGAGSTSGSQSPEPGRPARVAARS